MKPGQFKYHAARSADEAVAMLAEMSPHDGRVIAGGQSLLPAMALWLALPAHLVDISGVAEFARLHVEGDELAIDDATGRPGAVTQFPVTPLRLHGILRRK